jgi:hypothetical protein
VYVNILYQRVCAKKLIKFQKGLSFIKTIIDINYSSRRVVKNLCFAKDPMAAVELPEPYDRLLVCNRCSIVVHAGCYASPSIDIDDTGIRSQQNLILTSCPGL